MPRNLLFFPEGTRACDWSRLGPFHMNLGPKNGWNTRTADVWHDTRRDVLGVCRRSTKTKSRITDLPEECNFAWIVRFVATRAAATVGLAWSLVVLPGMAWRTWLTHPSPPLPSLTHHDGYQPSLACMLTLTLTLTACLLARQSLKGVAGDVIILEEAVRQPSCFPKLPTPIFTPILTSPMLLVRRPTATLGKDQHRTASTPPLPIHRRHAPHTRLLVEQAHLRSRGATPQDFDARIAFLSSSVRLHTHLARASSPQHVELRPTLHLHVARIGAPAPTSRCHHMLLYQALARVSTCQGNHYSKPRPMAMTRRRTAATDVFLRQARCSS